MFSLVLLSMKYLLHRVDLVYCPDVQRIQRLSAKGFINGAILMKSKSCYLLCWQIIFIPSRVVLQQPSELVNIQNVSYFDVAKDNGVIVGTRANLFGKYSYLPGGDSLSLTCCRSFVGDRKYFSANTTLDNLHARPKHKHGFWTSHSAVYLLGAYLELKERLTPAVEDVTMKRDVSNGRYVPNIGNGCSPA